MENNANRWMASALLLAMFGIIAYAGTRSTARQGVQNVLVTNTSNQQVPVLPPARPTANGAYIVAVSNTPTVKVVTTPATPVSTKEVNAVDAQSGVASGYLSVPANAGNNWALVTLPNTTPVVIDSVNIDSQSSVPGEYSESARIYVLDSFQTSAGSYFFPLQQLLANNQESVYAATSRILIPKGGSIQIGTLRYGGQTQSENTYYTLDYHTVTQ